jgi:hypothetical protein
MNSKMIAKIVKGEGFKGVVNYILDQSKGTELLDSEGVRLRSPDTIIQSFVSQAEMNPGLKNPVCHISLDFSAQERDKLNSELMVKISREYMKQMGISDTQYIIGRHYDKEHPHLHIVFNRVDNNGHTITDRNDRFRSEKICKELTQRHNLYFALGKENVKEHRLREPDKTKYEIYHSLKMLVPQCHNWDQIIKGTKEQDIVVTFKFKGKTKEIQGVIFNKNGYSFNGSKVDRQFSFSKINYQLKINNDQLLKRGQQIKHIQNEQPITRNVFGDFLYKVERYTDYNKKKEEKTNVPRLKRRKGLRM